MTTSSGRRKRIVVGHTFWGRGGAEIAAMWLIQALHERYEVHVATRGGWNLASLNRTAGTTIPEGAVTIVRSPAQPDWLPGAVGIAAFQRFCRHISGEYDLCITASRYIDWGAPAIHFLSDVTWNAELQRQFLSAEYTSRQGVLRSLYWTLAKLLAGSSGRSPCEKDLFVANSDWTAAVSQAYCSRKIVTIHPPVLARMKPLPWASREDGFVVLGRISPEKQIQRAIDIVAGVREQTGNERIRLYIIGAATDPEYGQEIEMLAKVHPWVVLTGPLYGQEKEAFVVRQRYGISACDCEAFGMATAEMVALGLIPFVPSQGAQRELVQSPLLCYDDKQDAVGKISQVLSVGSLDEDLLAELRRGAAELQPSVFTHDVLELVGSVLQEHAPVVADRGEKVVLLP